MDWTPVSYAYDGSFAGFLTCVFASYAHREEPMSFSTPEDGRISLWPERTVDTDEARAQRVYRSLAPRLGQEGRRLAVYGFPAWGTAGGRGWCGISPTTGWQC